MSAGSQIVDHSWSADTLSASSSLHRRAQAHLGTFVEISARGPSPFVQPAITQAFSAIRDAERILSFHDCGSALHRLNQTSPGVVTGLPALLVRALIQAQELAEQTKNLFNVVRSAPSDRPRSITDLEILDATTVRKHAPLEIDLGGMAKGYIVDIAVAALQSCGVSSGVVNAGGDLRVFGDQAEEVFIRDPRQPTRVLGSLQVKGQALATSADYFRNAGQGCRNDPGIWSPDAQLDSLGSASISVVAPDALRADALTKVVALARPNHEVILQRYGAHAIILDL